MDPTPSSRQTTTGPQVPPVQQNQPTTPGQAPTDQGRLQRQVTTTLNTSAPPTPPTPAPTEEETPVSRALDAFARADNGVVEAAASAYIMRTDKVEDKKLLGGQGSENGLYGSGKHESGAQASIYGRAEVVELADQYAILVSAGIIVGASLKLEGELKAKYGKFEAKIGGKLGLFAGALAKASGRLQVGSEGIVAQGKAEAFAGAKGNASAAVEFSFGELGVEAEGEVEGQAGAWAEAEGELSLSKEGIAVAGEAKAFAGVEGTVTGTGKAKLYGRDAFTVKGSVTGSLGAGGEVGGGFRIRGGKIQINVKAKGAVGFGGGGDVDLQADLKPMAVWTWRQYDKAKWGFFKKDEAKGLLDNPERFRQPLGAKLRKYTDDKVHALHAGKAENFVKIEKIQQYVGEVMPRKQVKGHANAATIDQVIKECIEGAIKTAPKCTSVTALVKDGKVEKLDNLPEGSDIAAHFKTQSKTGKALEQITSID